ncbi:hypothetical protein GLOIN_2v1647869 [Rhizophagus irregularis DAOM 181602=DAOM 197198]|uniref:Uncharacterized protein n=1 Tax=Rhizophagus irregularis (strain DAOM 181602 / DAOM 197198 / MUCL 43194) TaxID=747089 RepID=A0A2P4PPY1_RHIID|nr:hypothetical protein GLOIN_2v1647869 [Rhizophagus irregularis DAOM 181602=DAOM 197198]POG67441.1 hypothetical protein GLOIN_2v1647869 [Rhizophagus irregularis DAOM 181602=DAOM 197198]GET67443.1 hypothetical protein GLOIN_2v1647869 [Rhizophagus irregularis DAOM 181602=DAOM 197198]|eukprot:XP_025174307.1 hypothetical protein GLOIN_2v1647869 [Rhizophagus irregularis DAOM 181602=DAOM 197198]
MRHNFFRPFFLHLLYFYPDKKKEKKNYFKLVLVKKRRAIMGRCFLSTDITLSKIFLTKQFIFIKKNFF